MFWKDILQIVERQDKIEKSVFGLPCIYSDVEGNTIHCIFSKPPLFERLSLKVELENDWFASWEFHGIEDLMCRCKFPHRLHEKGMFEQFKEDTENIGTLFTMLLYHPQKEYLMGTHPLIFACLKNQKTLTFNVFPVNGIDPPSLIKERLSILQSEMDFYGFSVTEKSKEECLARRFPHHKRRQAAIKVEVDVQSII